MDFSREDSLKCKGFAILIMLFHHMYLNPDRYEGFTIQFTPFSELTANQIADFFKLCVGIYVFISAFGLTRSYNTGKSSVSSFVLQRTFKTMFLFYIVYIGAIFLSFLLAKDWNIFSAYGYGGEHGRLPALWYMLIDFLGLADLFGTPSFNGTWWYMSLAILLIFLIPVLNKLYDKMNAVWLLVMAILLPKALGLSQWNHVVRYLILIVLGILCARTGLLGICKRTLLRQKKVIKLLCICGFVLLYIVLFRLREGVLKDDFIVIWDSIASFSTICFMYFFVNRVAFVSGILKFFGRYSTLIFLTHTFIRYYWFEEFIYGHTLAWVNYAVFLVTSLCVAVILDLLLKVIRIRRVENYISGKIDVLLSQCQHWSKKGSEINSLK